MVSMLLPPAVGRVQVHHVDYLGALPLPLPQGIEGLDVVDRHLIYVAHVEPSDPLAHDVYGRDYLQLPTLLMVIGDPLKALGELLNKGWGEVEPEGPREGAR
jgi:hypothetical protein